jgi:hypothetical protein
LAVTVQASKVPGDLTDFPVYVDLSDIGAAHGFWTNVKTDGGDIRITKSDETTELPIEVVAIDTVAKTGEVHFLADGTLSSSVNTIVYVYYGNASASLYAEGATYGKHNVWISGYLAVWHLTGTGYTAIIDSTSNSHDAVSDSNTPTYNVDGKVGKGMQFSGVNEYINFGDHNHFSPYTQQTFTVSAWVKYDSVSSHQAPVSKGVTSAWEWGLLYINLANRRAEFITWTASTGDSHTIRSEDVLPTTGQWYHYVGDISNAHQSSSTSNFYANGALANNDTQDYSNLMSNTTSNLQFGERDDGALDFFGSLDEVRISNVVRSAAWVETEYNNQNDPSTFYTVGAEESAPAAGGTPAIIITES